MPTTKKFSDEQIKEALLEYGTFTGAAAVLGCSDRTVGLRVQGSKELQDATERGRESVTDRAESNIVGEIMAGNERASRWWLQSSPSGKRRGYGVRTEIAPAAMIDPQDFAPVRPGTWEEARVLYTDIVDVVLDETGTVPELPPQQPAGANTTSTPIVTLAGFLGDR